MPRATVLLAEDEESIRTMCRRTLADAGYVVVEARDGREAIELANQYEPGELDLLVTDLRMPDVHGLDAAHQIRQRHPDLGIVVITGYGTLDAAIHALQEGVSEFVLKPFRVDELLDAIARTLRQRALERENARLRTLIPLFELSRALVSARDPRDIAGQVVRIARAEMAAVGASLLLLDDDGELRTMAQDGLACPALSDDLLREVVTVRAPRAVSLGSDVATSAEIGGNGVAMPLVLQERALGALVVWRGPGSGPLAPSDNDFFSILASQAAAVLENARLFREIEEAYQRLSELDHLKSEFIAIASHELRAPLAALLAYATLSEAEASGPLAEFLGQVVDSAMQLKGIIDEMVSLRRIDTGEAQVQLSDVDLADLGADLVEEFSPLAAREGIDVRLDLPPGLVPARADAQVVRLILSSLLSNAIKFTTAGGIVALRGRCEVGDGGRQRVVVEVHDSGIGIPEEELESIFDRFYQVEGSLRREHGGIGLGLAIAREMAELIDGTISVTSEIAQGSTFSLSLPSAG